MSILAVTNLTVQKKETTILNEISFTIEEGDIVGLLGPSGAGKSSLFRTLNLLNSPTKGTIFYQGKNILSANPLNLRKEIGYVFQKPFLFGQTVKENLFYPYQLLRQEPNLMEINSYLAKVNLEENVLLKKNSQVSGGEQQRIALVRSLLVKPQILLLDEVTASLDQANAQLIEQLIHQENQDRKLTVLFISHSLKQAKELAQKIIYLEKGRIKFRGEKSEFFAQREGLAHE